MKTLLQSREELELKADAIRHKRRADVFALDLMRVGDMLVQRGMSARSLWVSAFYFLNSFFVLLVAHVTTKTFIPEGRIVKDVKNEVILCPVCQGMGAVKEPLDIGGSFSVPVVCARCEGARYVEKTTDV